MFRLASFAALIIAATSFAQTRYAPRSSYNPRPYYRTPSYNERYVGTRASSGDRYTFRDSRGNYSGSSATYGDRTIFRDERGRMTGTATRNGTSTTFRDERENVVETSREYRSNTGSNYFLYRDAYGRIRRSYY